MSTHRLDRPEGHIAYEVHEPESSPVATVLAVPGMGDLRRSYRHLVPLLVQAGCRVVVTDLRGHGGSSASFGSYGDDDSAGDVVALLEHTGPAVVLGSSMGAAVAVLAAARRPELVPGLVLLGPFVRDPSTGRVRGALTRLGMRLLLAPPWVAASWRAYLPRLYAGLTPSDHEAYLAEVVGALRRPGWARAFSLTTRSSHAAAEAALPQVRGVPALVVMGERDPDFAVPAEEAGWVADQLGGTLLMVPEAGHYPQSQRPELVAPAVLRLLATVGR